MLFVAITSALVKIFLIDFENGEYLYCLLSVAGDIVLALGVYAFVKEYSGINRAVTGFVIALFLPTVLMNTIYGGSYSCYYVPVLIWALYFLKSRKNILSFILLGAGLALGVQALYILPFYVFIYVSGLIRKNKTIRLYHFGLSFCIPLIMFLIRLLRGVFPGHHDCLSRPRRRCETDLI
jgi:Gpi18-like mannosyltransferase